MFKGFFVYIWKNREHLISNRNLCKFSQKIPILSKMLLQTCLCLFHMKFHTGRTHLFREECKFLCICSKWTTADTFFTFLLGDVVDLHFCCAAGMVVVVAVQAFLVVMVQSFHGGCTRSRGVGGGSKGSWPYGLNFCKTTPRMLEMMFYHQKNCRWIKSSQMQPIQFTCISCSCSFV